VSSQRQFPTDHDYAVSPREYQLEQSSPLPATAASDSVREKAKTKKRSDNSQMLAGSLHFNFRIPGDTPETPKPICSFTIFWICLE
jgi:hypothetical protein